MRLSNLAQKPDEKVSAFKQAADQGVDRKKWTIKPYCFHCKCEMELNNAPGALGISLVSMEITRMPENIRDLRRPFIGFKHPAGKALPDCPNAYANHPRFNYPVGRKSEQRERKKNRERLTEPAMMKANQIILGRLMGRLLLRDMTREEEKSLHRLAVRKIDRIRSLSEDPWRRSYLLAIAAGIFTREGRDGGKSYNVAWRPAEFVPVKYTTVNPEDGQRTIWMPSLLQLCFAYPQKDGSVKYVQMHDTESNGPLAFAVTRDAAYKIVADVYKRRTEKRKRQYAEAKQLLLQYRARRRGRRPSHSVVPGQLDWLKKDVA